MLGVGRLGQVDDLGPPPAAIPYGSRRRPERRWMRVKCSERRGRGAAHLNALACFRGNMMTGSGGG